MLKYERVHSGKEKSPYCIYALVHTPVIASHLAVKDEAKFSIKDVQNTDLFTDYEQKLQATKAAATSLQESLCFKSVVPKKKVDDKLSRLEDKVHDIFCQAMKAGRDTDAVLQFVGDLHLAMCGFRDGMTTDARSETNE